MAIQLSSPWPLLCAQAPQHVLKPSHMNSATTCPRSGLFPCLNQLRRAGFSWEHVGRFPEHLRRSCKASQGDVSKCRALGLPTRIHCEAGLIRGNKASPTFGEWVEAFGVIAHHWPEQRCWECLICIRRISSAAGHGLTRRKEV